jgi:hypothetical protein
MSFGWGLFRRGSAASKPTVVRRDQAVFLPAYLADLAHYWGGRVGLGLD